MPAELAIHIANTRRFIAADPENIVLKPRARVGDGKGGFRLEAGTDRSAQTMRLIPQSDRVPEVQTSDGKTAQPEFVLLAMPDAIMHRYDQFMWRGATWEVAQVHLKPEYEMKGDVIRIA